MTKILIAVIIIESSLLLFFLIKICLLSSIKDEYKLLRFKINSFIHILNTKFIFNTFTTINTLCYEDPFKAQDVNNNLSNYLRGTFNLINNDNLVDFNTEFSYINSFLQIEEIHLRNKLIIEKKLNFTDFKIPNYSLNIFVQNFIYYSVYVYKVTGLFSISTDVEDNNVVIRMNINALYLADSQIDLLMNNEQFKISLKRISEKCRGCVTITSSINSGTTIEILLPVEGKHNEYIGS